MKVVMLKTCWVGGVIRESESEHDFPENVATELVRMNRAAAIPAPAECKLPEPAPQVSEGEDSSADAPGGKEDDEPAPAAPSAAAKPAPAPRKPALVVGAKTKPSTAS